MTKNKRLFIYLLLIVIVMISTSCGDITVPVDNTNSSISDASDIESLQTESNNANVESSVSTSSEISVPESFEADITAEFSIVYDEISNKVLYEKNADTKCYPASLTKLMTAIVAVENIGLDEEFSVGNELSLVQMGSSSAFLEKGQKLTLRMLLDAMLLPSGNDAAYVIASGVIRKLENENMMLHKDAVAKFCKMMNDKAIELGAVNTHFVNPDGWHDENHYTTARDMLLIAQYAHSIPVIAEVTSTVSVKDTLLTGEVMVWANSNKLMQQSDDTSNNYYNEYVQGMKTGYTDFAGNCLVAYGEYENKHIFALIFNAPTNDDRYNDITALLNKAFFE